MAKNLKWPCGYCVINGVKKLEYSRKSRRIKMKAVLVNETFPIR